MGKTYLFARKVGIEETRILEVDMKSAVGIMRQNRNPGYQLGILTGPDYSMISRVYGEYSPFKRVSSVDELIKGLQ